MRRCLKVIADDGITRNMNDLLGFDEVVVVVNDLL
jgi:hypothetical protein